MARTRELKVKTKFDGKQFRTGMQQMKHEITGVNRKMAQLSGIMQGAFVGGIVATGIGKIVQVIRDFDSSTAELRAVLLQTADETKNLTEQAKRLGGVTKFTASEVVKLQVAYGKLGFTNTQIENATEATLDLAAATNTDLARSAEVAGATVKAFGLDASKTGEVVDIMALSFSRSALDLEKFATSMATVAPVAKTFGFSVGETTALLGTLANAGFDASMAGTATRNILLNLADANGALAQKLGGSVKTLPELIVGLNKLKEEGIDLNETLKITDKRSVAAFSRFLNGTSEVNELNEALKNANGTAKIMADERLKTLDGKLAILQSSWEGFILSLEDGSGVISGSVMGSLKGLSTILTALTNLENNHGEAVDKTTTALRGWAGLLSLGNTELLPQAINLLDQYNKSFDEDNTNALKKYGDQVKRINYLMAGGAVGGNLAGTGLDDDPPPPPTPPPKAKPFSETNPQGTGVIRKLNQTDLPAYIEAAQGIERYSEAMQAAIDKQWEFQEGFKTMSETVKKNSDEMAGTLAMAMFNIGESLGKGTDQIIQSLIKQTIAYYIASAIQKFGILGVPIAAGAGLVVGQLFKQAGGSTKGSSAGGSAAAVAGVGTGFGGADFSFNGTDKNITFKIAGQDLVGVFNNYNKNYNRITGGG